GTIPDAVHATQLGAFGFLTKPVDKQELLDQVQKALKISGFVDSDEDWRSEIITRSSLVEEKLSQAHMVAGTDARVLITGESGTGKELVARALHEHSPRASKPFIALNTSAIPSELLESELFGHEKGSFTGADTQRRGRFEQANGGTLFLDEIGDMSTPLQTRLLRVLAEGEFYRVGGQTPVKVDVRVIAATHQNLEERVERGIFREDLYHRLNVIRIELPPLRSRTEDVPDLLAHYLRQAAAELGTETKTLAPVTLERLQAYRWPGNVRELVNLCRRLTALAPGSEIQLQDLPSEMHIVTPAAQTDWAAALTLWAKAQPYDGTVAWLDQALPEFERVLIRVALNRTHGHRQEAARVLGWGRNTLTRKLKELGMSDDESLP
ncbi:MAG TPA: sigma 54-interacting transcriptional regulator, partial [Vicinamibacterales bacterium]